MLSARSCRFMMGRCRPRRSVTSSSVWTPTSRKSPACFARCTQKGGWGAEHGAEEEGKEGEEVGSGAGSKGSARLELTPDQLAAELAGVKLLLAQQQCFELLHLSSQVLHAGRQQPNIL